MKNEKIAEDLLNLYVEELLNEDSKKFVEENLNKSDKLRNKLKILQKQDLSIKNNTINSLSFISNTIKKDKKNYGIMLTSLVVSILIILFSFLTKPIHFENDGNLYNVTKTDQKIFISFNKDIIKVNRLEEHNDNSKTKNIFLDAYTSRLDQILNKTSKQTIEFEKNKYDNIYYENQKKPVSIILGNKNQNMLLLPRLALNTYLYLISISSIILIAFILIIKKYKKLIKYIIPIPISFLLAMVFINGFKFYSFYLERDFIYIMMLFVGFCIFSISLINLIANKKGLKINN